MVVSNKEAPSRCLSPFAMKQFSVSRPELDLLALLVKTRSLKVYARFDNWSALRRECNVNFVGFRLEVVPLP